MNLKEYKISRNVSSLTKVKELCKIVFDNIPDNDLTEAQITALDNALKNASDTAQKQLTGSNDSGGKLEKFGENKIETRPPESLALDHKVIQIMGQRALIKNRILYGEFAKLALQKRENQAYTLAFQVEQRFYNEVANTEAQILNESQNRMQQVVDKFSTWSSFKTVCKEGLEGDTEEDLLMYEAALAIFEELGV